MISKSLTFDDVLLVPSYSPIKSRGDVSTEVQLGPYTFTTPLISANMDTITGVSMAIAIQRLGGLPILHRFCGIDANVEMYKQSLHGRPVGVSIGVSIHELDRYYRLYAEGARIFCVDVAHAHSKLAGQMVQKIREHGEGSVIIIAGNVATYAGADFLASRGADAVKVGIGAGSVCTTREKTGFGVPQLTAIMECSKARVPVIADGGMRKPGDVVKALAAGATMVMLGGMLAGTDETPDETIYRGMASIEAQEEQFGGLSEWATAEGVSTRVGRKGPVEGVIKDILGGLRSGLSYAGAQNIAELHKRASFIEVSHATFIEGTPHGESN